MNEALIKAAKSQWGHVPDQLRESIAQSAYRFRTGRQQEPLCPTDWAAVRHLWLSKVWGLHMTARAKYLKAQKEQ